MKRHNLVLFFVLTLVAPSLTASTITTCSGDLFIEYISAEQLRERIDQLADQINADYAGKEPVFVGVLNGCMMFMTDLLRSITLDCMLDTMRIASYDKGMSSQGHITLVSPPRINLSNKDVIIVEDIIDTGLSIAYIYDLIMEQKPKSLAIVALLKKEHAPATVPLKYVGFTISNEFVIGYGLDLEQHYRNLPAIYKHA